jgi:hypothetical protein
MGICLFEKILIVFLSFYIPKELNYNFLIVWEDIGTINSLDEILQIGC